jgi:hypothetical protein
MITRIPIVLFIVVKHVGNFIIKPVKRKPVKKEIKLAASFTVADIPDGYEIYEESDFYVHGVKKRMKACIKWATGENLSLEFKREPSNKYDTEAIAVYGISSNGRRKIGYVAAELADDIVERELEYSIIPRLLSVEIEDIPFIKYEILINSEKYSASFQ